uniref:NADH-ubiquinone oxidoreductase chain 2 n=1 Tax=Anthribidae sp. 9 ACP-2013 TaxID=1434436 RepID=A0A3G5FNV4_9CUCU|nr:NADH dehydrogenase subunit 2 [Anthribidae sp. 9 ACP-2013]
MLFFNSLILSTIITATSISWLMMWIGLEINLLSMMPLMNSKFNNFSNEAMLKYFISQSLASMIFLFSIIMFMNLNIPSYFYILILILNSSLLLKMGAAPLHFWFPQVMEGLNWNMSMLMLTWQKIAPFIVISYNMKMSVFLLFFIISSSIVGSILGLNQISLRKILTFSSINHISWMLSSLMNSTYLWMIYFITYSFISLNIIIMFKKLNIFYLKQLILKLNSNKMIKFFFLSNFFSLGGIPPFLGFLPKWMTINFLMDKNLWMISIILIFFSLITLFFYTRITLSSILINYYENLNFQIPSYTSFLLIFFNFMNLMSLILVTYMFFPF